MKNHMIANLENQLPIDWELGKKLAGNQLDLAEDLLNLLITSLPNDFKQIKTLYYAKNYAELQKAIHKLHGALSYCGTPRLKTVITCFETHLKNNIMDDLPLLFEQLDIEVNCLLKHHHSSSLLSA
jgi:two-component system sensor histidine kinase BarA